jgi:hypothetical protein
VIKSVVVVVVEVVSEIKEIGVDDDADADDDKERTTPA